jgi:hypothetical protein
MRILITGSRDWTDRVTIVNTLYDLRDSRDWTSRDGLDVVLVSGACPTGADRMCERIAEQIGWKVERHPADWSLGKSAGFQRNRRMVELGADIGFAFIAVCTRCTVRAEQMALHGSHGASHAARLAREAKIPMWEFRQGWGLDV